RRNTRPNRDRAADERKQDAAKPEQPKQTKLAPKPEQPKQNSQKQPKPDGNSEGQKNGSSRRRPRRRKPNNAPKTPAAPEK
ncbi:MAG: hypothetical protein J5940_05250, partial [Clostridia bacterium]|nr:hypothetical protein [Clostridia bacterium]